jgi:hypothetical protein
VTAEPMKPVAPVTTTRSPDSMRGTCANLVTTCRVADLGIPA